MLQNLWNGKEWEESGYFPRVTMCDFKIRTLGNLQNWSIQCVLMINMFNEKIFMFLWWWFLIVVILTAINIIYWIIAITSKSTRRHFLSRYLAVCFHLKQKENDDKEICPEIEEAKTESASHFIETKLRPDVTFLLRLIAANQGDVVTTEIVNALWNIYQTKDIQLKVETTNIQDDVVKEKISMY